MIAREFSLVTYISEKYFEIDWISNIILLLQGPQYRDSSEKSKAKCRKTLCCSWSPGGTQQDSDCIGALCS